MGKGVYNKNTLSPIDAGFVPIRKPERLLTHGKSFYKVPKEFPARFVMEKGAPVFVLGYPDALWEPLLDVSAGSVELGAIVYRTSILTTTQQSYEYTYDPDTVTEKSQSEMELPPDPTGLSGSGLWLLPRSNEESLRLLGINIEHVSSARKCIAMFIEVWMSFFTLALRGQEDDKVRSILDDAFKNVSAIY